MADQDDTVKVRVDSGSAQDDLSRFERAVKSATAALKEVGSAGQASFNTLVAIGKGATAFQQLASSGKSAFDSLVNSAQSSFGAIQNTIRNLATDSFDNLRAAGSSAFSQLRASADSNFRAIRDTISGAFSGHGDEFFKSIASSVSAVKNTLASIGSGAFDSIRNLGSSAFTGLLQSAQSTFGAIKNTIGNIGSDAFATVRSAGSAAFVQLRTLAESAFASIRNTATTAFNYPFLSPIVDAVTRLVPAAQSAFASIRTAISTAIGSDAFGNVVNAGVSAFNILRTSAQVAFGGVRDAIANVVGTQAFGNIVSSGVQAFNVLRTSASVAFDQIRATIATAVGSQAFGNIVSAATSAFGQIRVAANTAFDGVRSAIGQVLGTQIFGSFVNTGVQAFGVLSTAAGVAFDRIRDGVTRIVGSQTFGNIANAGISAFEGIRNVVGSVFSDLGNRALTFGAGLVSALNGLTLNSIFQGVRQAGTTAFQGVQLAAESSFNAIRTGVSNAIGSQTFQSILAGAGQAFDSVKNFASTAFTGVSTAATNAFNSVKSAISNVASGATFAPLISGATNAFNTVRTAASNAFGQVGGFIGNAFTSITSAATSAGPGIASVFGIIKEGVGVGLTALSAFGEAIGTVFNALKTFYGFFLSGGVLLIDTLNKIQGFQAGLSVINGGGGDGARKAASDYDFLRETANRLGVEFSTLLQNFARLSATIPESTDRIAILRNVFTGLSAAARTFHLSATETQLSFLAIEQMASKGIVSMEELRRQLGQRLPGIIQDVANALGTTPAKFEEAVKKGTVDSIKFITLLGPLLGEKYAESADKAGASVDASINRLKNIFVDFSKEVLDSGGAKAISDVFDALTEKLSDPQILKQFAAVVVDVAVNVANFIRTLSPGDIRTAFNALEEGIRAVLTFTGLLVKSIAFLIDQAPKLLNAFKSAFPLVSAIAGLATGNTGDSKTSQSAPSVDEYGNIISGGGAAFATSRTVATTKPQVDLSTPQQGQTFSDRAKALLDNIDVSIARNEQAKKNVSAVIESYLTNSFGVSDLSKYQKLIDTGSKNTRDALQAIAANTKTTEAVKQTQLDLFAKTGILPVDVAKKLSDLQVKSDKKVPLTEGERYIKQLETQQAGVEHLTATEKLLYDQREGKVKFTGGELAKAQKLAGEIDVAQGEKYIKQLDDELAKKEKISREDQLTADIAAHKVNFATEEQKQRALSVAKAIDDKKVQDDILKTLLAQSKLRETLREEGQVQTNKFGAQADETQDAINNLGGNKFDTQQAQLKTKSLNEIQATYLREINLAQNTHHDFSDQTAGVIAKNVTDATAKVDLLIAKNKELYDKSREFGTGVKEFYQEIADEAGNQAQVAKDSLDSIFKNTESAIDTFLETGKFSFGSFAKSAILDLEKIEAKALLLKGFKAIGDSSFVQDAIKSIGGFFGISGGSSTAGAVANAAGAGGAAASDTALATLAGTAGTVTGSFGTLDTTIAANDGAFGTLTATTTGVDTGFGTLVSTSGLLDGGFTSVIGASTALTSALYAASAAAGGSGAASAVKGLAGLYSPNSTAGATDGGAEAFSLFDAKGDAFSYGKVLPFARGGIFDSPHTFPLANGGVGLLGEAGPEAIMPLARGADGKLGVKSGGGGQNSGNTTNIQVNVEVNSDGSSDVQSNKDSGAVLGHIMVAAIQDWVSNEKRPGGQLEKAA